MSGTVRIAFLGSRGIPANYGGAEVFVEEISRRLTQTGFEVYVSCESRWFHTDIYHGITRLHAPSIEGKTFTIPTVNEIIATFYLFLKYRKIDAVYFTASHAAPATILPKLLGKKVIVNTDGLEWKRPLIRRKYLSAGWRLISPFASWYLKTSERLAVKLSDVIIADSMAIKAYLEERYGAGNVVFIPYGARETADADSPDGREDEFLEGLGLRREEYYLTVARVVTENNIHQEINSFQMSPSGKKFVIVGNFDRRDRYTQYLHKLRDNNPQIQFLNPIYDKEALGILRKNCYAYVHAYEVGGTNPSLLEQMFFGKPILAYDVPFHREVLRDGGIYYKDEKDLARHIGMLENGEIDLSKVKRCQAGRIAEEYNWDEVARKYGSLFRKLTKD